MILGKPRYFPRKSKILEVFKERLKMAIDNLIKEIGSEKVIKVNES